MTSPGTDVKGTELKIITVGKYMDFHIALPNLSSQKPCWRIFAVNEAIDLPPLNCQNGRKWVGGGRGVAFIKSPFYPLLCMHRNTYLVGNLFGKHCLKLFKNQFLFSEMLCSVTEV